MRSHNVPALRLEGFDGEWEIANLGELTAIGGSGGTPSSGNPEYYGGDIPFLAIADIEQRVVRRTAKTLTEKGLAASAAWLVPKGSLTLAMYASVGRVAIVGVQLATSQAFYNMTFSDQALRDFIYARLNRMEELDEWKPYISTGTQQNLNAEKVTTLRLSIPSTLEEQQAIGAIFTNLDAAINQHTKKHQALQQAKIALMQRMFPQECQTVPELRLEGFDGEWAIEAIGEFARLLPHNSLSRDQLTNLDTGVSNVHYGDILVKLTAITSPDELPCVKDAGQFLKQIGHLLADGDVVFADAAEDLAVGKCTEVRGVGGKQVVAGLHTIPIRPLRSFGEAFLGYAFNADSFHNRLIPRVQGTKVSSISARVLLETELAIPPTLEEQQAIGAVFTRLDTLIAAEAKYIESLKQTKTALLQQMFI